MTLAVVCLVLLLGGVFLAASSTQNQDFFTLRPPGGKEADVFTEAQRLNLHRTFFTAWAALILVTPALCTFLFRRDSASAARYWLAFWTVGFVAFLVHFCWAVCVLFDGEWSRILQAHVRVSAPRLDTVVTAWWGLDVLLAWLVQSERGWIRIQRVVVHLAVFVLFFLGSAIQGEHNGQHGKTIWSVALGTAMGVAVLTSVLFWLVRLKKSKRGVAPRVSG